jgi:uncharacterized protein (TIGR03083 family)
MAAPTVTELVDALDDVLRTTLSIARDLSEADGELATDCPGWTVKDHLAHMVSVEQVLAGAPVPDVELPPLAHVVGEFAEFMERLVHVRRALPLSAIADEMAGLTPRRVEQLRALAAEGDPDVPGAFGPRPLSVALPIRVFDLWQHEQDIRRATGLPVRTNGTAAAVALGRTLRAWSTVLPKSVQGVDGQLAVEVTGPKPSTVAIELGAGGPATATLRGDLGELTWLGCGRGGPTAQTLSGDAAVVEAVRPHLGFTP